MGGNTQYQTLTGLNAQPTYTNRLTMKWSEHGHTTFVQTSREVQKHLGEGEGEGEGGASAEKFLNFTASQVGFSEAIW